MTRRAVVSYALDSTQTEKIRALQNGIFECVAELIIDHGQDADDVMSRCEAAVDIAVDDREREA